MNESLIILVLVVVIVAFGVLFYFLSQQIKDLKKSSATELLKTDLVELSRNVNNLQQSVGEKLDRSNQSMQTSMQKQLSESAKLISNVTQRLTELDKTNQRVGDVADELKTLQNVLLNPKQRGVFGEYYLKSVLDNVLPPQNFQMQYKFADGQIVDAVVFLDKGQILPIDSKFSLENYNRMIAAETKSARDELLKKVRNDLKGRIDETSKYIRPRENTMDFAFMFIPSESLYYDLLISEVGDDVSARDLVEYAFRDKHVIIVSSTIFMAYLQTVLQGLRSLQIEEQAKDIQKNVGKLGQHIAKFDNYMQKLGRNLGQTVGNYNDAYKELGHVDKDVLKISGNTSDIEPSLVDKPRNE